MNPVPALKPKTGSYDPFRRFGTTRRRKEKPQERGKNENRQNKEQGGGLQGKAGAEEGAKANAGSVFTERGRRGKESKQIKGPDNREEMKTRRRKKEEDLQRQY